MGLRGPGAVALRTNPIPLRIGGWRPPDPTLPHPWAAEGLSRAERVIRFMESLPVTSGKLAGTQFRLREWQKKEIRAIYRTDRYHVRRVRTAVWSMGRKNGKTDIAARLALCHTAGPEAEQRGEVYAAANDRFQAGRIFAEICAIVERVPWLAARISIRRHSKELEDIGPGGTGTAFAALSADVATKHGLSPSFVVYDELGQATSRDLFDALDTGMGARFEPMMLVISTQAAREDAPLSELIDYGLRVQAREVKDPSFHLTFYAAPPDADPWAYETWKLANPALGDFRSIEDVKRLARQAQRMPSREASFRNLILNQRVDTTQQFLTVAVWKAGAAPVNLDACKGRPCWGALDLSASRDLTALVLGFGDAAGGFDVAPLFWLPADDLDEREEQDRAPYTRWRREGHLLTTPGRSIDPKAIALKVAALHAAYHLQALAYDRWRIEDFKRELAAIGCAAEVVKPGEDYARELQRCIEEGVLPLVPWGQGFQDMAPAIDVLERLAVDSKLRHGGHPVLTMCIANAKTTTDPAGNRKLDKKKSTGRIDGAQALAMMLGVAHRHEAQPDWSPMVEVI